MIHTQDLEKIIALVLYSAYVEGEKAVSAIIVSDRPESGKTEVVNKFYGNRGLIYLSDVTAFALWRDFHKEIASGEVKHLIVPEFLAPLSRKGETVASFIATLQMLVEEGIMEIHTGFLEAIKLKAPASLGAILCLPRREFVARRQGWELSGFLSRFLVVSYSYDKDTVDAIFKSIANRDYMGSSKIKLVFPEKRVGIELPRKIAELASEFTLTQTELLRKKGRGYGFRELKNMLRLLCANVLLENAQDGGERVSVNLSDYKEVERLSYLINEEFNCTREGENVHGNG